MLLEVQVSSRSTAFWIWSKLDSCSLASGSFSIGLFDMLEPWRPLARAAAETLERLSPSELKTRENISNCFQKRQRAKGQSEFHRTLSTHTLWTDVGPAEAVINRPASLVWLCCLDRAQSQVCFIVVSEQDDVCTASDVTAAVGSDWHLRSLGSWRLWGSEQNAAN